MRIWAGWSGPQKPKGVLTLEGPITPSLSLPSFSLLCMYLKIQNHGQGKHRLVSKADMSPGSGGVDATGQPRAVETD